MRKLALPENDSIAIDLHSTGTSPVTGIPLAPGASDPYWAVVLGQAGFMPSQARLLYAPPCVPSSDVTAAWIWVDANGTGAITDAAYVFRNLINLANVDAEALTINFTVSTFNAEPFVVAVNGRRITPETEKSFQNFTARTYTIPGGALKRILNTLDVLVRVNPSDSGTAALAVRYGPCLGTYCPTVVTTRPLKPSSVAAASNSSLVARIPVPQAPSPPYQDLTVPLGASAKPEVSTITAQIVTLDECDNPVIPVGAPNVYQLSSDPTSNLTVRVLGYSASLGEVFLRVWSHPAQGYSPGQGTLASVSEATGPGRPVGGGVGGVGDPVSWPTNSGVVVVVTDTGGGPMEPVPTGSSINE